MTPVSQRILAAKARADGHNGLGIAGDCFRAALASILDLPYEVVPHVCHYSDGRVALDPETDDPLTENHGGLWWRRTRRWLRANHGLDVACYEWDQPELETGRLELRHADTQEPWSGYVLLGGRSPRGEFAHQIVGYYSWLDGFPTVSEEWDPHPSREGLRTIEDVTILVEPYDPPPPDEAVTAG